MSKPIYAGMTKPVTQIEDGKYGAKLCQIVQIGAQRFSKEGKEWFSPQIIVWFEIPGLTYEKDGEVFSQMKSGTYFLSLNPSRNGQMGLREIIDSLRGNKEWTEEELEKFDISQYLGKACLLTIASVESKGKSYLSITAIEPIDDAMVAGMREPVLITTEDFRDIDNLNIPEWIKDKIRSSQEFMDMPKAAPINEQYQDDKEEIKIEDVPF